jgi:hypothetical protein
MTARAKDMPMSTATFAGSSRECREAATDRLKRTRCDSCGKTPCIPIGRVAQIVGVRALAMAAMIFSAAD